MWVPHIPFAFLYAPLKVRVYASTNGNAPTFQLSMARAAPSFQLSMARAAPSFQLSMARAAPSFQLSMAHLPFILTYVMYLAYV